MNHPPLPIVDLEDERACDTRRCPENVGGHTQLSPRTPVSGPRVKGVAPPDRRELAPGDVIGGRYRLERSLGAGGMGEVWAAMHETIRTRVAVKLLLPRALHVPEIVTRFEREALLMGRVHGAHVPGVIDYFVDAEVGPMLITELVEGQSLADVLRTPLSVEAAIELGIDLASGLSEIHRASVVHRDLKPSNVILRGGGAAGAMHAYIIDLGVGRLVEGDTASSDIAPITTADIVVGTAEYMAPEQVLNCKDVTPSADLYALGALLFRAVAGVHVFGPDLGRLDFFRAKLTKDAPALQTERDDALARGFAAVVAKALEREPARRYQTADELRSDSPRAATGAGSARRRDGPDGSAFPGQGPVADSRPGRHGVDVRGPRHGFGRLWVGRRAYWPFHGRTRQPCQRRRRVTPGAHVARAARMPRVWRRCTAPRSGVPACAPSIQLCSQRAPHEGGLGRFLRGVHRYQGRILQ